jgi:hypothetical protein
MKGRFGEATNAIALFGEKKKGKKKQERMA